MQLNTALYKKMFEEQEKFRSYLMGLPPEEIIKHSYEYTCREDILLALEYNDLTCKQAKALLKSPCPLADVFTKWERMETDHMANVWSAIEGRAKDVIHEDGRSSRGASR